MFGPRGPIDNRLRFADEPARHKVLDLIGDLSLCGFDLAGHVVAYRSGHALNVELARALVAAAAGTRRGSRCRPCRRPAAGGAWLLESASGRRPDPTPRRACHGRSARRPDEG